MEDIKVRPPKLHIAPNGMEATLTLRRPQSGEKPPAYTVADLLDYIEEQGVTYGVLGEALEKIARDPIYDREITIARGMEAIQGIPGYFEFFFETNFSKSPKERPDGSVDYMSIKVIEIVHEGDMIAEYHPAEPGVAGLTVRNVPIEPRQTRELPPLAGRGFIRSDDNLTYTSAMDGKIEMQGKRIIISPVYEISENADVAVGNINFNGDVLIHGGVSNGVKIVASGNITVQGLVESCEMQAGGSIFLLRGVKGGEKTKIVAANDITVQFVEYATLRAGGNIQADVFFKSDISCDGAILLTGKRASVIGGCMAAIEGIEAYNIGNDFGIKTEVTAGVTQDKMQMADMMQRKIDAVSENVEKIKAGIRDFEEMGRKRGVSVKEDPRRMQLLRVKIRDEAIVAEEKMKLDALRKIIERGKGAKVIVNATIYPGVEVTIGDQKMSVKETQSQVEVTSYMSGIRMERLDAKFI